MSAMQAGMLLHTLTHDPLSYRMQMRLELEGPLDVPALRRAWQMLVDRHDVFRTLFAFSGSPEPLQVVYRNVIFDIKLQDASALSFEEQAALVEAAAREQMRRPFDSRMPPLLSVLLVCRSPACHTMLVTFHHVLMDGWCQGVLHQELLALYDAARTNTQPDLPPAPAMVEYIRWLRAQDEDAARAFWAGLLADVEDSTALPGLRAARGAYRPERLSVEFPAAVSDRLRKIGQESGVSFNAVFQTIWGILTAGFANAESSVFGMVVSGRPPEVAGIERMIGLFINTVALRVDAPLEQTFLEVLRRTGAQIAQGMNHHHLPTAEILSCNPLGGKLLSHAVAFESFPDDAPAPAGGGLTIRAGGDFKGHTNFDFLCLVDPSDTVTVHLKYNAAAICGDRVQLLADSLLLLAQEVCRRPEARLRDLQLLPENEQAAALRLAQGVVADYALESQTVLNRLAEVTARHPQRLAVAAADGRLTYAELAARSGALARGLLASGGVEPGQPVAVFVERDSWMLPALLGVLRAGGGYVPIDPGYPPERVLFLLQDSGARAVLTTARLVERLPAQWQGMRLDAARLAAEYAADTRALPQPSPDSLAYIIYTSGSTGQPKGVMVEHRSLLNFTCGFNDALALPEEEPGAVAMVANYVFDASGRALYPPLLRGATVHVIDPSTRVDGTRLARYLAENAVDILDGTPTLCRLVLDAPAAARQGVNLKHLICGGEAMPASFVALAREGGAGQPQIHNVYGPTETTIDSTWLRLEPAPGRTTAPAPATNATSATGSGDVASALSEGGALAVGEDSEDGAASVAIGRPLPNQRTYILDRAGRLLPRGAVGELCIAGAGVARGYLNRPELEAERFVPDPFAPGERMYRTGDRVRWNARGEIAFLGRMDDQLKIRGYRIEPGEIEKRLAGHPDLRGCAVAARPVGSDELELVAYYCAENDPGEAVLREWLARELPPQMVPGFYVRLPALPLTATGKVDRRSLPTPDAGALSGAGRAVEPPASELERRIADCWAQVLGRAALGRRENFFDAGGHSLRAARAAAALGAELRREIPPMWVYLAPTVAAFAQLLSGRDEAAAAGVLEPYFLLGDDEALPVFCFPPFGGCGIPWTGLAHRVAGVRWVCFNYFTDAGTDGNVVGGLRDDDAGAFAVAAAAAMMRLQPAGEMVLAGYSGGGSFACAAARVLEARGRVVRLVALFDSWRRLSTVTVSDEALAADIDALLKDPAVAVYLGSSLQQAQARTRALEYSRALYGGADGALVRAPIRLLASTDRPASDPYPGPHGQLRGRQAWAELAGGGFTMAQGEGDHDAMLSGAALGANAAWFCQLLRECGRAPELRA